MITNKNTAEIATASDAGDTTETPATWRQFNWEIYTWNPSTGSGGWDIKFRNVTATSKRRAFELLSESAFFDVAILYNGSVPAPIEYESIWDTPKEALDEGCYHTSPNHPETLWGVYWDQPRGFGLVQETTPDVITETTDGCQYVGHYHTETRAILHLQRLEREVEA
jgi:hypothetical protein